MYSFTVDSMIIEVKCSVCSQTAFTVFCVAEKTTQKQKSSLA